MGMLNRRTGKCRTTIPALGRRSQGCGLQCFEPHQTDGVASMRLVNVYDTGMSGYAFLYKLIEERTAEESISHGEMPEYSEHVRFVNSKPYFAWYIIEAGIDVHASIQKVGACLITHKNEIGIAIAKEHRRNGYARQALTKLLTMHDPLPAQPSKRGAHFVANINPGNEASIKLFTGLGARHIQNTYQFD